jgi:hypothetical protein
MITSKNILKTISEADFNTLSNQVNNSDSSQKIIDYISQYLQDLYGVAGDKKEVRLVLNNLIANATSTKIREMLVVILKGL